MDIAVIGGGAAGCFCAAEGARRYPEARFTVFEAASRPMAKLAVTGGGRCNFTNSFEGIERLAEAYPRGERLMKRALGAFSHRDAMEWFRREGVEYVIQDDHCVFPASQDAMEIVGTLESLMKRGGVRMLTGRKVKAVEACPGGFLVDGERFDRVVVTTGGAAVGMLAPLGLEIEECVPSLFTFNIDDAGLRSLMGTVVENARLSIAGTGFKSSGALLLTDWGTSGPTTLKLSSYAARHLHDCAYKATLLVDWTAWGEDGAREWIDRMKSGSGARKIQNSCPEMLSSRLWKMLVSRSGLREDASWGELGSKGAARLVQTLCCDPYPISGRCRFKSEFVTCGGVSLKEVNPSTMEARRYPGLFLAGEVLDIDAITGGFNLQAAWSTGYLAALGVGR